MLVQMVVLVEPAFEDGWASIFWRFNQQRWFNHQVMLVQNAGVGSTSIWKLLNQHFLKVQPTKMVQPSGNVGSKCWCWFNCQVMLVQNGGVGSTSIWKLLNQHFLKVQPTPAFWTNKTWWLNLHKMMVEPDKC